MRSIRTDHENAVAFHEAQAKIRARYIADVRRIAEALLTKRVDDAYSNVGAAELDLEDMVNETTWFKDRTQYALVLFASKNPDIADRCLKAEDLNRDDPLWQRAQCAMEADVSAALWIAGWTAINHKYRTYPVSEELSIAIFNVVELGLTVCDQLEVSKHRDLDLAEVRFYRALEKLRDLSIK